MTPMTREKLEAMAEAIRNGRLVEQAGGIRTETEQSDKLGFDWKNIYVNDILVRREYIEQEHPVGTADSPIEWKEGMSLIQNAYYTHEGETRVWMGEAGAMAEWDSGDFVAA